MEVQLTKSAKKSLATIYKLYSEKVSSGTPKSAAANFIRYPDGTRENSSELVRAGFIKADIIGGFILTDKAIIFMENHTVDTIKDWLSFGAQFIP